MRDSVRVIIPYYFSSKLVGGNVFRGHLKNPTQTQQNQPAHSYYGSDGMWRDRALALVLHPGSFK